MLIRFIICICMVLFLGCDDVNKTSSDYGKAMVKTLDTCEKNTIHLRCTTTHSHVPSRKQQVAEFSR